ncbi:hypothetical protein BD769DRAFT_1777196 [Suillus cothurnatus]|nr:hypothetical protein BD769DRAFT_1777196 [Suillus cothurnatus]
MEYSSDNIAAARSMQFAAHSSASMATIWIYHYACSFHEEWTFLLRSQWSKVKSLYVITRYLPFIIVTANLYLDFTSNNNPSKCRVLGNMDSGLGVISVICSECTSRSPIKLCVSDLIHPGFFILRTYALWNKNRILLITILSVFFTFLVVSFIIDFTAAIPAAYVTSTIPGITGCYDSTSSTSFQLFIQFLLLSVFQLGLMILTLIRAIQSWRIDSSHLYVVLIRHNIFYYACGFSFSLVNIFTSLLLQDAYQNLFYEFQVTILAILATHMHLYLWQMNQPTYRSDALVPRHIPISDMSFVHSTV